MISPKVKVFAGIVLAICAVLFLMRMINPPGSHMSDWDIPWTLECENCGKRHEQSKLEFASRTKDRADFKPSMINLGHCPHCDQEWCARIMRENADGELEVIADGTYGAQPVRPRR